VKTFALLGSGEFEPWSEEVDRWVLGRVANPDGAVLILPTASAPEGDSVFDRWADMGLRHFERLEARAEVVPLKTREDARRPDLTARLDGAASVYFSGGNPAYLASVLQETPFWTEVRTRIDQGLGYAGCSAGIACLGEVAPDSARSDVDDDIWQPGLRLFPNVHFGPHWDMLDAFVPGLRGVIEGNVPRHQTLFAVDERTAAVGDGTAWTVKGLGSVRLRQNGTWREWSDGESFAAPITDT
jgi:cyanophycinase-like exopeptidase